MITNSKTVIPLPAQNMFCSVPYEPGTEIVIPWNGVDFLELPSGLSGRYRLGFAHSNRCVEAALELRYLVFNVELGEGLEESHISGLDRDAYDAQMTHLVLIERASSKVVGTYRLQTARDAFRANGLYSSQLFDLSPMSAIYDQLVECGRACIDPDHRSLAAVVMLWQGILHFVAAHRQRHIFGCCSITTTDPDDGWRAMKTIRKSGFLHHEYMLGARETCSCGENERENATELDALLRLPRLFNSYMRLGARVISRPAVDRRFGTVDFLVMADNQHLKLTSIKVE
ncbi:MAG: GNAT family N-acyltransferase [bacterium]